MNETDKSTIPPSIYWGGCGFGCAFYIGVHRAMVELWGSDFHLKTVMAGGSAGCVTALQVCLGRSTEQLEELYRNVSTEAMRRGALVHASSCLMEAIQEILNQHGCSDESRRACDLMSDRFWVSLTKFPFSHKWRNSWSSDVELFECITASCHIPLYSQRGNGKFSHFVDGAYGFSGNALKFLHGNDTLYIGIDPTADISRELTNRQMLFPLEGEEFDEIVQSGYDATMRWHSHRTMKNKMKERVPNYTVLSVLWVLRMFDLLLCYFIHLCVEMSR